MRLALAGINHRTAPVQIREKLAFRTEDVPAALLQAQSRGAKEALILSTCNRVEITAILNDDVPAERLLEGLIAGRAELSLEILRPHVYVLEDEAVIRHLFRVASSLDSMIVGEPQILGQLKQAYAIARDGGAIGRVLETVLPRAFNVAKRIRSETEIGQNAVSVSYAAVELAREIFGSLNKKRVLIIGAGKMSESAARHLLRAGIAEVLITNRTRARAEEMAELFQGSVVPYEQLPQRLADADIVISSSAAPGYVLTPELVRAAIETRRHQPMFFIDIAVPRNVDPAVNDLEHAFLYDMDDLQRLSERNLQARREIAELAEKMVADEVTRLQARLRERDVVPTIVSLQEQLETLRKDVLDRYRPRMGALTSSQEDLLEALTRSLINKVAHGPISELRRDAALQRDVAAEREGELVSVVRRMFRLRDH